MKNLRGKVQILLWQLNFRGISIGAFSPLTRITGKDLLCSLKTFMDTGGKERPFYYIEPSDNVCYALYVRHSKRLK